ncbi:hypothetical protein VSR01_16155 [Actinacidiphila sp. DG2A-62]|uniref:hypothetical protein n=1 Tax=Actinacidiphila sp. DG2A-62 TaxID=3108821 RepID=UPI002DB5B034|nr:hypothetical protein [Actinacidiphila sp. DG2A-62]MEC3994978.1 hypothetical protein [Actinacidiphila sp. DG2A-62]
MKRTFALNTEPHVADVGGTELLFQPEVMGDDFMDAYAALRETHRGSGVNLEDLTTIEPGQLRAVTRSIRTFLAQLMLPESAELFTGLDVVDAKGTLVSSHQDLDAARAAAEAVTGGRVTDRLRLPDRVLVELLEWVVELYSGGTRPPTSSGGSATASPPRGRRGTGVSPSRASTPTAGR